MEKIAFIIDKDFIYWSHIITALAAVAAVAVYVAMYLKGRGNIFALAFSIPLSTLLSILLARLVHWYCRTNTYSSLYDAMTDHSTGDYALLGVFAGCLLAAGLLRVLFISRNMPQMLDCMAVGGGVGIAVGRLSSMFNASDRGMILPAQIAMPLAYPVTNAVSGVSENRLATFMIQSILAGGVVALLILYMLYRALRRKKIRDGDICLLFLLMYGACQIVCDSTRYDSLFLRSNGFISVVQIFALVGVLIPVFVFSVRMVKARGFSWWYLLIWLCMLASLGVAGYMEYYVQRHGSEAVFAYSVMSSALLLMVLLTLIVRILGEKKRRGNSKAKTRDIAPPEERIETDAQQKVEPEINAREAEVPETCVSEADVQGADVLDDIKESADSHTPAKENADTECKLDLDELDLDELLKLIQ